MRNIYSFLFFIEWQNVHNTRECENNVAHRPFLNVWARWYQFETIPPYDQLQPVQEKDCLEKLSEPKLEKFPNVMQRLEKSYC